MKLRLKHEEDKAFYIIIMPCEVRFKLSSNFVHEENIFNSYYLIAIILLESGQKFPIEKKQKGKKIETFRPHSYISLISTFHPWRKYVETYEPSYKSKTDLDIALSYLFFKCGKGK